MYIYTIFLVFFRYLFNFIFLFKNLFFTKYKIQITKPQEGELHDVRINIMEEPIPPELPVSSAPDDEAVREYDELERVVDVDEGEGESDWLLGEGESD
jgi:hypothetical protein